MLKIVLVNSSLFAGQIPRIYVICLEKLLLNLHKFYKKKSCDIHLQFRSGYKIHIVFVLGEQLDVYILESLLLVCDCLCEILYNHVFR